MTTDEVRFSRDYIRRTIKELITSIKAPTMKAEEIPDDLPLFKDPSNPALSPINLDSLDGLELALAIAEHFNLNADEDIEPENFLTVGDITESVYLRLADAAASGTKASSNAAHGHR